MVRRRKQEENKVNHDRWLVSYADFVTLLFGFFVVMYSVSHVSESKYRTLSETLGLAFKTQAQTPATAGSDADLASIESVTSRLQVALADLIESDRVALSATENWVEITLNSNLLFDSGSAIPRDEAEKVFADVAALLAPYENAVDVSGHTDSVPIATAQYRNNWELSAARATAVVTLLAQEGVAPARMSATGYGEFRPVADNSNEAGRNANRRVVLHVARHRAERPSLPATVVTEQLAPAQSGAESASERKLPSPDGASLREDSREQLQKQSQEQTPAQPRLKPIVRKDGSLLFTNDPEVAPVQGD